MLAESNRNMLGLSGSSSGLGWTFNPSTDGQPSYAQPSDVYATNLDAIAPGTTGIISDMQASGETWMQTLARSLPILTATYQQRQLLQVQVDRARAGLPPLDVSNYGAGVQVGLSKDTQKMLLYGAVGIAALFLLAKRH